MRDILAKTKVASDFTSGDNIEIYGELEVVLDVRHEGDAVMLRTTAGLFQMSADEPMTELYLGRRY